MLLLNVLGVVGLGSRSYLTEFAVEMTDCDWTTFHGIFTRVCYVKWVDMICLYDCMKAWSLILVHC